MRKTASILLFFIIISCSSGPVPKNILSPEKMQKIVYELMQTDEYLNTFVVKDSTADIKKKRSLFYGEIFKMNNTSRKEFYISYRYYQQHPNIQKALYDSLYEQATRKKDEKPMSAPVKPAAKS